MTEHSRSTDENKISSKNLGYAPFKSIKMRDFEKPLIDLSEEETQELFCRGTVYTKQGIQIVSTCSPDAAWKRMREIYDQLNLLEDYKKKVKAAFEVIKSVSGYINPELLCTIGKDEKMSLKEIFLQSIELKEKELELEK